MLAKLTKRTIDAARCGTTDVFLWDTDLKGFGLKITPKDRRLFIVQYWAPNLNRVRRRVTLCTFGVLTVEQARDAATRILGRVANGEDPGAEASKARRDSKEATLVLLSAEYLEEVRAKMKPTTAYGYTLLFTRFIVPVLGKTPVTHITVREVAALHLAHKAHPYQANRILQLLKTFLYWAERRGYRARNTNPCRDVTRFPEHAKERFLTVEEVGKLGTALIKAERDGLPPAPAHRKTARSQQTAKHRPHSADTPIPANPFAIAAIRFLILTGWREQEALTLQWADIDFARGWATLPNTKTGKMNHTIGVPALELLTKIPRLHGSPYVFPGGKIGRPLREIKRVWYAARHAAGLDDVRLHDLRHTVASFSAMGGHSLYLTGKLLGHRRPETTQRYAHLTDDARKATADSVATAISAALNSAHAKVLPLKTGT